MEHSPIILNSLRLPLIQHLLTATLKSVDDSVMESCFVFMAPQQAVVFFDALNYFIHIGALALIYLINPLPQIQDKLI
jgi:hypothetical protein